MFVSVDWTAYTFHGPIKLVELKNCYLVMSL